MRSARQTPTRQGILKKRGARFGRCCSSRAAAPRAADLSASVPSGIKLARAGGLRFIFAFARASSFGAARRLRWCVLEHRGAARQSTACECCRVHTHTRQRQHRRNLFADPVQLVMPTAADPVHFELFCEDFTWKLEVVAPSSQWRLENFPCRTRPCTHAGSRRRVHPAVDARVPADPGYGQVFAPRRCSQLRRVRVTPRRPPSGSHEADCCCRC
jgi:hypothetical protein